jgi:hypothetical protein
VVCEAVSCGALGVANEGVPPCDWLLGVQVCAGGTGGEHCREGLVQRGYLEYRAVRRLSPPLIVFLATVAVEVVVVVGVAVVV